MDWGKTHTVGSLARVLVPSSSFGALRKFQKDSGISSVSLGVIGTNGTYVTFGGLNTLSLTLEAKQLPPLSKLTTNPLEEYPLLLPETPSYYKVWFC